VKVVEQVFLKRAKFSVVFIIMAIMLCSVPVAMAQSKEKLKPEDVVAKHLESIGPAEARAGWKSMVAVGTTDVVFKSRGTSQGAGTILLASDGNKNLVSMLFDTKEYPYERIGFNGDKVTGADIRPGERSPLINFLLSYDAVLRQGLLGGSLSTAWPLLKETEKYAKLEYGGLKKIDNRQLHELKYSPRKGGDMKISLFFDAETFQHVRTEYRKSIATQMGTDKDASLSGSSETRYKMVEEFADFKAEGKLMLPHTYKLSLAIEAPSQTVNFTWSNKLDKFTFDQPIKPEEFSVNN
jgi:hypothetical protein